MQKIQLLLIDPQEDFCNPKGSLYVPGADEDMKRLATMIDRIGDKISQIQVTLDCHYEVDVAHPPFWVNSKGENPAPFTIITSDNVRNGDWKPFMPSLNDRMLKYVETLEDQGKFSLCVWPPHCLIGTPGNNVYAPLAESLQRWQRNRPWNVNYVSKGSNVFTENYSAIEAEIPDANDPSTQLNTNLIKSLISVDTIVIAGEAGSHCVNLTVRDICNKFGDDSYLSKIVLLTDAMSPVKSFENEQDKFIQEMKTRGCRISTTLDFLS